MKGKKLRDVTGKCWSLDDADGDSIVVYTPAIGRIGFGTQRRRSDVGFGVILDRDQLDKLIAELQDRRARMP